MTIPPRKYRFTVHDYHRMAEAGILGEDDRVELIEGEIIEMSPIGSRHAGCVNRLTRLLVRGVGNRAVIGAQNPVRVSDLSEPQPDIAVLEPRADDYAGRHPEPADVLLLIEVADTSLAADRDVKAPLYAVSGIAEYWIVDLENGAVDVFRDPTPQGYRTTHRARRGETLRPLAFPELTIAVGEIVT